MPAPTATCENCDSQISAANPEVIVQARGYCRTCDESMEAEAAAERPRSADASALALGDAVTECCGASVTFHDETLCCKSCWKQVG